MNPAIIEAKKANTKRILMEILINKDISRVELSKRLGLSPATVALTITEMVQKNLIVETNDNNSSVGRKARLIRIKEKTYEILSVRIRHSTIYLHLCDLTGHIRVSQDAVVDMVIHDNNATRVMNAITDTISDFILRNAEESKEIMAMTIIVPGIVDNDGMVDWLEANWQQLPLAAATQYAIDIPVFVDIALRIIGQYEMRFLPVELRNKSVVFLSLEPGIGLAYYIDGKIIQGRNNMFGEIGHVSLDENGPTCYCGNKGCFELYCEKTQILKRMENLLITESSCLIFRSLVDQNGGQVTLNIAFQAFRKGSTQVQKILMEAANYLGRAILIIRNILDPNCIILSGDLVTLDPCVLQTALSLMRERVPTRGRNEPNIRIAKLPPNEFEAGVCLYTFEKILDQLL
jgi:N-acetylglucosamine repressor